jgi:hypothetical protein
MMKPNPAHAINRVMIIVAKATRSFITFWNVSSTQPQSGAVPGQVQSPPAPLMIGVSTEAACASKGVQARIDAIRNIQEERRIRTYIVRHEKRVPLLAHSPESVMV